MTTVTENNHLVYEDLKVAMLLTATGGFMDSYSYLTHGARFASLQSGNVILMAINLVQGKIQAGLVYLFPIISFAFGAGLSFLLKKYAEKNNFHRHQLSLFIELLGMLFIGLLANILADNLFIALIAFLAAIQADTFTKLRGMPYANIMTTGNIKTAGFMLIGGFLSQNKVMIGKGKNSLFVVLSFFIGALISALLVPIMKNYTILGVVVLLAIVFAIIRHENVAHPNEAY